MDSFFTQITYFFDPLHHFWENDRMQRKIGFVLVLTFLSGIVGIELNRRGLLPEPLAHATPTNHFYAVNLAFSLVLILEVISFIFSLPCSFSKSVGKQFEILALILLRDSFKELIHFPEPIAVTDMEPVYLILSYAVGSLIIFALLGLYYRLQPARKNDKGLPTDLYYFVAAKKFIALVILATFIGLGATNAILLATGQEHMNFFAVFYTLLIFTDILVVLVSQCFRPSFHAVFRNSGYVVSTLLIRLALAAPPYYNVSLGMIAIIYSIGLTLAYTRIFTEVKS